MVAFDGLTQMAHKAPQTVIFISLYWQTKATQLDPKKKITKQMLILPFSVQKETLILGSL